MYIYFLKRLNLIFFLFVLPTSMLAQSEFTQKERYIDNEGLHFDIKLAGTRIAESQVEQFLVSYFKLNKSNTFRVVRKLKVDEGEEHIRYAHFVENRKVIGSEVIGHFRNGILEGYNGILYKAAEQLAIVDQEMALEKALTFVNAEQYMWQNKSEELMLKSWTNDSDATFYPKAELVYVPQEFDYNKPLVLCYAFEIYALSPLVRNRIYISAMDGSVWANEELIHIADANGVANTKYRGNRSIVSDSVAVDTFRLRETGRGNGIETYNLKQGKSYANAVDFIDDDNYWNNYNANFDEVAGDAHYGAEITYDYYFDKFNRNSYDDNGAKIRSYVHYSANYSNAFWNGYAMTYGDGNGTSVLPLISIDVCGHEISHAVTTNSANLVYSYESGALNESFSDIFGNAIEYYADSNLFNWRMGEDITSSGRGLRNMANPNAYGDPNTYKGKYWHTSSSDNGGVHTNSGVQNYWFYLLCEGDTGTNDNGDYYFVDSLGMLKAEAIAYRNLTVYLTSSSDYEEARYYAIRSAADLFGECSNEVIATTNAWYAVGVGDKYDSLLVTADFQADTAFCYASEGVQFRNKSANALSYKWYFGDADSSSVKDPKHFYPSEGIYTVKLIAEGCFGNVFDTMEKLNYLTIDSTRDICNAVLMPVNANDTVYACNGFLYDNGGENNYSDLAKDTITIWFGANDSAQISFEEFGYENKFDSLYVYDGFSTNGKLLGAYTGFTLPNGGNPIKVDSGAVTITHFSDTYVNEIGFKLRFEAFRPKIQHMRTPDTLVCYKQQLAIEVNGSGGDVLDYEYYWNGVFGDSIVFLAPERDTVLYLKFGDACRRDFVYDTIYISVRDSLKLESIADTTLCYLQDIQLVAKGSGGDTTNYIFTWSPNLTNLNPWNTEFSKTQFVQVALADGCSEQMDTIGFNVYVRDSIQFAKTADATLCEGDSIELFVDVNGGLNSFAFQSSLAISGGPDTAFSTLVKPIGPGLHKYWISFTDQCTDTKDTAFYAITMLDSLKLSLTKDTTICYGTSIQLIASASGGKNAKLFDWGNGFVTDSTHVFSPKITTLYTLNLKDGCSAYEPINTVLVTVLDSLQVAITALDTACYGESLVVSAVASGGSSATYSYNWQNAVVAGSSFTSSIWSDTAINVVFSDGCSSPSASAIKNIIVRNPLSLKHASDTFICLNESLNLSPILDGGVGNYVMSWDNGLGTGLTKVVSPTVNTTYQVMLSDNCSKPLYANINVVVNPLPIIDMDANPKQTCQFKPVVFTNKSLAGVGSTYVWYFGDGDSSKIENSTHSYKSEGNYTTKLKVTNEFGCTDLAKSNFTIEIQSAPKSMFIPNKLEGDFFNAEILFNNVSTGGKNYLWNFDDGSLSSEENPTYRFRDTGYFTVYLVVSNDVGCFDTSSVEIRIKDVFYMYVPNAFSPNSDGVNDVFHLQYRGISDFNLTVFNRWGEILWHTNKPDESWDGKYQGKLVEQGVYFYSISGSSNLGNAFGEKGTLTIFSGR